MRPAFLDHGELIFWQHLDRSRPAAVAAILDTPFGASHSPRLIEASERSHAVVAAADSAGGICLARLRCPLFDSASLGVSNHGRLAVAFVTSAGALRVLEPPDGGQTWVSLGVPTRLQVPGIRIPFIDIPPG